MHRQSPKLPPLRLRAAMMIGDYRYDPPQGGKDGWYNWLADGPHGAYGKTRGKGKGVDGKTKLLDGFGKGYVIPGKGGGGNDSWTSLPIVNASSVTQWFPMGPGPTIPDPDVCGPDVTVEIEVDITPSSS